MSEQIFLASVPIHIAALLRNANDTVTIERGALDLGYHIHGWLTRCLGKDAIKPFTLRDRSLLGYSPMDADALQQRIDTFAEPAEFGVLNGQIQTKPMPSLKPGTRLDFEVRVAPTVRLASAVANFPKGAEVDAYEAHLKRHPEDERARDAVYRDWLEARLGQGDAAALHRMQVAQRKRSRVLRRTQGDRREAITFDLPDVTLQGTLTTGPGFHSLLRKGIGRHKAFGFGMLLLRPPSC